MYVTQRIISVCAHVYITGISTTEDYATDKVVACLTNTYATLNILAFKVPQDSWFSHTYFWSATNSFGNTQR